MLCLPTYHDKHERDLKTVQHGKGLPAPGSHRDITHTLVRLSSAPSFSQHKVVFIVKSDEMYRKVIKRLSITFSP